MEKEKEEKKVYFVDWEDLSEEEQEEVLRENRSHMFGMPNDDPFYDDDLPYY